MAIDIENLHIESEHTDSSISVWCDNPFMRYGVSGHSLNVDVRFEPCGQFFLVYREYYNEYDYEGRGGDFFYELATRANKPTIEDARAYLIKCIERLATE